MKNLVPLLVFVTLLLTGCPLVNNWDYDFKYETIIRSTPVNLEKLNTAYDDYNSDLPYAHGRCRLYFSSSRNSAGDNFDIVFRNIEMSYHERDDVLNFSFPVNEGSEFNNKLFQLVNTQSDELGPFSFFGGDGWDYFFFSNNASGNFDIKFAYNPILDWGTYDGQKRIFGPDEVMLVKSEYDELYPAIDKDNSSMFFCSNRENGQFDIFSIELSSAELLHDFLKSDSPVQITKETVLSSVADDKCPSIEGNLMVFASDRAGGYGGFDLYYSVYSEGHWGAPVNFGETINSGNDDYRPIVLPFEGSDIMIFSSERAGGKGGFDLYCVRVGDLVSRNL